MPPSLHIDNTKLKHNFENYKLKIKHDIVNSAFTLPHDLAIDKIDAQLGYKEFAKRVALNDLFVNQHKDLQALFFGRRGSDLITFTVDIDEVRVVWYEKTLADNTQHTLTPKYTPLLTFPPLLNANVPLDTPSAASLNSTEWVLSDGSGRLFVSGSVKELLYDGSLSPFFIHTYIASLNMLVISTTLRFDDEDVTKKTQFDLMAVDLTNTGETLNDGVVWRLRTLDYPFLVEFVGDEWTIGSSSGFVKVGKDGSPINEVDETPSAAVDTPAHAHTPPAQYGWSQDGDTVTISIKLDHIGDKQSYAPIIQTKQITLPSLHHDFLPLYTDVDVEGSTWTLNRQLSLLEVDLSKKSEQRWVDLFDQSFSPPFGTVDETRSKQDLEAALQSMEKYTQDGDGTQEPQLRPGGLHDIPSLAKGEIDDAVDSDVGKSMVLTKFKDVDELTTYNSHQLLSTPFPSHPPPHPSIVISHDLSLSGTLLDLDTLAHTDTFAALPFVMASKRDLRFAYHLSSTLVIVFEGGKKEGAGNAFIYHQCENDNTSAAQSVVQIGGYDRGALLGVAYFHSRRLLVALCENSLVVLSNLI